MPQPCLWEARPRGERGPAATSKAEASPRGRASHQKACSYFPHSHAPEPCLWEARPRGEFGAAATSTANASPRGRASYKERVRTSPTAMHLNPACGRRALAANAVPRPPQQQQLRPGAGLPQRACSYLTHSDAPAPCLWEARPRGEPSPVATSTARASPRGRASHKERVRTSPTAMHLNPACGRRALAANAAPLHINSKRSHGNRRKPAINSLA